MRSSTLISFICSLAALIPHQLEAASPQYSVPVIINPDQTITYQPTPKGDRISDFSTVGYNYGNTPLPDQPGGYQVPVLVTLSPQSGDQTDRIQAAIDFISTKPLVNGFRGALLLKAGRWELYSKNKISIKASGVVIRGEGDHPLTGTQLRALLPDATLYPDTADYTAFTVQVRRNLQGAILNPQASNNLVFGPASTQLALLVETTALDAEFDDRTYVVVPAAGGPASPRAFLRFVVNY